MIDKLHLHNFRCFSDLTINFSHKNFLYGKNGSGKTSLIESLFLCSHYRPIDNKTKNSDLIFNKNTHSEIYISKKNIDLKLCIEKSKNTFLNNFEISVIDFLKEIKCIFFLSDEVFLLKKNASYRRKYIDQLIFNINTTYVETLVKYNKILKNRNNIIKSRNNKTIDLWTDILIEINNKIVEQRKDYIAILCNICNKIYKEIFEDEINIEINIDNKDYNKKIYNKEIEYGYTLFGNHLDSILFRINGINIDNFFSNGQIKKILLVLKIAHLNICKNKNINPFFIIDDIDCDFDRYNRDVFLSYISTIDNQVLITSTTINNIKKYTNFSISDNKSINRVNNGK